MNRLVPFFIGHVYLFGDPLPVGGRHVRALSVIGNTVSSFILLVVLADDFAEFSE